MKKKKTTNKNEKIDKSAEKKNPNQTKSDDLFAYQLLSRLI